MVLGSSRDFKIAAVSAKQLKFRRPPKASPLKGTPMNRKIVDVSVDAESQGILEGISAPQAESSNSSDATLIGKKLQTWVKFVEKDTETQVHEYLEQVDAGQNGE